MKRLPIVALIGQTNAGKSSLLNRLSRSHTAITACEEGTTRDNVIATVDGRYKLIDTAGLKDPSDDFEASIRDQIEDAIDSADLILIVMDSTKYPNHDDKLIAKNALRSKKPVLLALNKTDLKESLPEPEFLSLGIKNPLKISATTGQGISALREKLEATLAESFSKADSRNSFSGIYPPARTTTYIPDKARNREKSELAQISETTTTYPRSEDGTDKGICEPLTLSLIGRPNVGKSSLFNTLAKKQQAIVSSRSGTTRDINRLPLKYHGRELEILDTAGLRKPGKREVGIEKFSALKTLAAIEESDICLLLVDATEPHSKLDQALAGEIVKAGKGIILIITKSDLIESDSTDQILDRLETDFNFIPYAPVIITSSKTGANVTKIFDLATKIAENRKTEIKTSELNKILNDAIISHPPAGLKNTRPKPKYIVQTDVNPPWFVVHGHSLGLLHWSWKRYLERKIRESYPLIGTPINFSFHSDD